MNDEVRGHAGQQHEPGWPPQDPAGPWSDVPVTPAPPAPGPHPPLQAWQVNPPLSPPQGPTMPVSPAYGQPPPPQPPQPASWDRPPEPVTPHQWPSVPPAPAPHEPFPSWNSPRPGDPLFGGGPPRVVPVPRPPKRRTFLPVLIVGLVVAVLAGGGGYLLGTLTGGGTAAKAAPSSGAASPSLPAFEASQMALNKTKLDGDLAPLAQPWLPSVGGCLANTDIDGPKLLPEEIKHVFCRYGGVAVHFALYKSANDRDVARNYRAQLNLTGAGLAPGQAAPARKPGGTSGAQGNYVEYAFKENDGRVLCGIWWDRDGASTAMYMETLCEEGLGGSWDPLRDLWHRHS